GEGISVKEALTDGLFTVGLSGVFEFVPKGARKVFTKKGREEVCDWLTKGKKQIGIFVKVNIDGKEIICYVLLEFQSKVDFQMPMRLLFYMAEIWREILKNTTKQEKRRKDFRLPAIIPIVLYNGKNNWTACRSFKEILNGYELFEDNILDFSYILFDVNRYEEEELYNLSNLVSSIFLLDQEIDQKELIRRLTKIKYILKRVSPEQFDVFKQWLKKIIKPRLDKSNESDVDKVLDESNQREVDIMVHNLEKTLDNIKRQGIEQGIEQGLKEGMSKGRYEEKRQVAMKMIKEGLDIEIIMNITGLNRKEVLKLKRKVDREKH
ncbi:Rpn family recombination-promoting nuclease/putative transposase, partial [Dethiothermospora halolimnae]|uniref:Rpn family recombination-promoting nuclease/putative transposase n=1 Tax=Dethiothermospora halolimnae TaxID=3114390 RepID=UPI003CCC37C1